MICERVVVVSKFRFYLLKNGKEESDAVMMVQLLLFVYSTEDAYLGILCFTMNVINFKKHLHIALLHSMAN